MANFFNRNKADDLHEQVIQIDVERIRPNPLQPRKQFDPMQMEELSRSITENGVIQPIIVRQAGEIYEIVAGERRLRAAKMSRLATIPAIVRQLTDRDLAEIALVENLQRADLSFFEEAEGYLRLIEEFHMTQEEVAEKVGKSQPTIANKLRILKIDPIVKENIMVGLITERHVRALLRLKTTEEQLLILKEIYENELNVKDTEQLITAFLEGRLEIVKENEIEDGSESAEQGKQTIRRMFSDYRIYINTVKAAVETIRNSGIDAKMDQEETDESLQITITIPKTK